MPIYQTEEQLNQSLSTAMQSLRDRVEWDRNRATFVWIDNTNLYCRRSHSGLKFLGGERFTVEELEAIKAGDLLHSEFAKQASLKHQFFMERAEALLHWYFKISPRNRPTAGGTYNIEVSYSRTTGRVIFCNERNHYVRMTNVFFSYEATHPSMQCLSPNAVMEWS